MHHAQIRRKENIGQIVKTIAKTMPTGIEDRKLRAFLGVQFGFADGKVSEYLENLVDLGTIEKSEGIWKILQASPA